VIVEQAAEARANDTEQLAREKKASKSQALQELLKLLQKIDKSGDGMVSLDEIMGAFHNVPDFRNLMTVMDLTKSELQVLFEMADRDGQGLIEIGVLCKELFALKNNDTSMLLAMIKFSCQETHSFVKSFYSKMGDLTKQGETLSAQVNLLNEKIEHLMGAAEPQPVELLHEIGAHPREQRPFSDTELQSMLRRSSTRVVTNTQEWSNVEEMQQEVQDLLHFSRSLLTKAIAQVDISSARLTRSLSELISAEGVKDAMDIKTIEVWLAVQKYHQCKATLEKQRDQLVKQHHNEFHNMPDQTKDRQDLVSPARQGMSQLKDLVMQLLQLNAHDVPKSTIFGL